MRGHMAAAAWLLSLCGPPALRAHEHGKNWCKDHPCDVIPNSVCTYSPVTQGKYTCTCKDGYAKNMNDECEELPAGKKCSENGDCLSKNFQQCIFMPSGDTKCVCMAGYGYTKKKCNFKAEQACDSKYCQMHSTCYNYAHYNDACCRCNKGYIPKDPSDPYSECVVDDSDGDGDDSDENDTDEGDSGEDDTGEDDTGEDDTGEGDSGEGTGNEESCPAGFETDELLDGNTICLLKDCYDTAAGCCPDGESVAAGPGAAGCNVTPNDAQKIVKRIVKVNSSAKPYLKALNKIAKSHRILSKKLGPNYMKMKDCCQKDASYDCNLIEGSLGCGYRMVPGEGLALCCPMKAAKIGLGCDCLKCIAEVPPSPVVPWWKEKCFNYGICRPVIYSVKKIDHFCIAKDDKLITAKFDINVPGACKCKAIKPHPHDQCDKH